MLRQDPSHIEALTIPIASLKEPFHQVARFKQKNRRGAARKVTQQKRGRTHQNGQQRPEKGYAPCANSHFYPGRRFVVPKGVLPEWP